MSDNNLEQRVSNLEKTVIIHDEKFNAFMRSMDDFKQEMRDFKQEMRQQNEMRAREIMELRRETDQKFERLETKIDSVNMYAHQMFIAAAIGIGAMILTVVAPLIFSSFKEATAPSLAPQQAIHTQLERSESAE